MAKLFPEDWIGWTMAPANQGSDTQDFSAGCAVGVRVLGCRAKLFPKEMFKVMSSAWASGSC